MTENSNRLNDHGFPAAPAYQGAVARGNPKTAMADDGESASRLSWRDPEQPTVANSPGCGANPGGRACLKAWRGRLVQELKAKGHSQRGMRRRGWWSLPNSCDWGRAGIVDSIIPPSYQHFPAAAGRTAPQGLTLRGRRGILRGKCRVRYCLLSSGSWVRFPPGAPFFWPLFGVRHTTRHTTTFGNSGSEAKPHPRPYNA